MFVIRSIRDREPALHQTVKTAEDVAAFLWGRAPKDWQVFQEISVDISNCHSVEDILDTICKGCP